MTLEGLDVVVEHWQRDNAGNHRRRRNDHGDERDASHLTLLLRLLEIHAALLIWKSNTAFIGRSRGRGLTLDGQRVSGGDAAFSSKAMRYVLRTVNRLLPLSVVIIAIAVGSS